MTLRFSATRAGWWRSSPCKIRWRG